MLVALFRQIRAHPLNAVTALLTGWVLWIVSLIWFFPYTSHYFFAFRVPKPYPVTSPFQSPDFNVTGFAVSFSLSNPIDSARSLLWMPVGATISQRGLSWFLFAFVLPLIVAGICGWLVAQLHRRQRRAAVLLFATSILPVYAMFFGTFVWDVGFRGASLLAGRLAAFVAALVLGVLAGGGILRGRPHGM